MKGPLFVRLPLLYVAMFLALLAASVSFADSRIERALSSGENRMTCARTPRLSSSAEECLTTPVTAELADGSAANPSNTARAGGEGDAVRASTSASLARFIGKFSRQAGSGGSYGFYAIALITVLSLAPAILVMVTSFTRIIIVLHFLRQAIGVQGVPPNQVLMGLAVFLTYFSMGGVVEQINTQALKPYMKGAVTAIQAADKVEDTFRDYMGRHVREVDLAMLVSLSTLPEPRTPGDIPFATLVSAFVLGELRAAFLIGLLLFLPFLVIDIVVAVVLTSSGLGTLSPAAVSLPFKILLFVLIDGWNLVIASLLRTCVG